MILWKKETNFSIPLVQMGANQYHFFSEFKYTENVGRANEKVSYMYIPGLCFIKGFNNNVGHIIPFWKPNLVNIHT